MAYLIKILVSAILIAAISEVSKRSPFIGAVMASLPLVSILAVIWLWRDTHDLPLIASHMQSTFWMVLPSLPMFLVVPALMRHNIGFWGSLGLGIIMTASLYALLIYSARHFKFAL